MALLGRLRPAVTPERRRGLSREAVTRPTMRFVPGKSAEGQGALVDHRTRDFPVRRQTRPVNAIRARLAEFGPVHARGIHNADRLRAVIEETPEAARPALDLLAGRLRETRDRIGEVTDRIAAARKEDPLSRRLATIPGIGTLSSRAFAATTPEVGNFEDGAGLCGMARPRASSAFRRGQGAPRADIESGQPLSSPTSVLGRHEEPSRRHAFETDGE